MLLPPVSRKTSIHAPDEAGIDDRWNALWEHSSQRSPFSRLEYARAISSAAGLSLNVHFVSNDGVDLAAAALTHRRRGPYREVVLPPFTPFSAVLLREPSGEDEVHGRTSPFERLLAFLEGHYHIIRLHLHPTQTDVRPANWRGWHTHPLYTYVLALTPDTDPRKEWSGSAARNYRIGRGAFDVVEGGEAFVASVNLCGESYGRHGRRPLLNEAQLLAVGQHLREAGLAVSFAARRLETARIEAAATILRQDADAFYWVAGSTPGTAMTVLVGEMISRLAATGTTRFDFMGANVPSIAEFKRKFGSRLQIYYRLETFTRGELRILRSLRAALG
jgi:hypothetical protein